MIDQFPSDLMKTIEAILESEKKLSYGEAAEYNSYIANAESVTSVSASGKVFVGPKEVKGASIAVASRNLAERNRKFEWISAEFEESMAYIVFRSSLEVQDSKTNEFHKLGWIVSMVFGKNNDAWKIIHRQNTRWNM